MEAKFVKMGVHTLIPALLSQGLVIGDVKGGRHDEALPGHETPHPHERNFGYRPDLNERIEGYSTASSSFSTTFRLADNTFGFDLNKGSGSKDP